MVGYAVAALAHQWPHTPSTTLEGGEQWLCAHAAQKWTVLMCIVDSVLLFALVAGVESAG